MTVLELAECVGADRKHVSDHLCGRRLPTPRRLAEYALAIGCEIDEIYDTERVGL
jgi:transcriptional regulator with XRE-family HTH domain